MANRPKNLTKEGTADWLLDSAIETNPDCAKHMDVPCLERPDLMKSGDGYTQVQFQGKKWAAHRLINEVKHGDLGNLYSLHRCDNSSCLRPDHLYRGTQQDNVDDRRVRERGKKSGNPKLNGRKVLAVITLAERGVSQQEIALKFGVHKRTIDSIIKRRSWKHVQS